MRTTGILISGIGAGQLYDNMFVAIEWMGVAIELVFGKAVIQEF